MKKKLTAVLLLALLVTACSSTKTTKKTNVGVDSTNKYAVEDTEANKKPLEDIIVFNEEGVTIRREGNNLILSMPELILFDFDKYAVLDGRKHSISTLAKAFGDNKDIHITVAGFSVFIGTEAYNLDLSVKRARAIKDFLISKGAIGSNISIEGYGEQNPAATNQTEAGRSKNRRVEFIISRG